MYVPRPLLAGLLLSASIAACTTTQVGDQSDQSMYLTGSEEAAVTGPNGQPTCTNAKKVLICHIPPGNPANEHSICVGKPAVEPHQRLHGDTIGACPSTAPPPPAADAGANMGGSDGSLQ
jgi:hypothetical protein